MPRLDRRRRGWRPSLRRAGDALGARPQHAQGTRGSSLLNEDEGPLGRRQRVLTARIPPAERATTTATPATAGGITFLNIEDETGMVNVICTLGLWQGYHRVARASPALLIRGVVEKADGVVSLLADRLEALPMRITAKSRDFR
ncbi:hypothetical protein BL254_13150 [Protofrankia sp. BMG5.30]|uniref:OB domain-containing protein n=1 Tax=Protofrankia coriariae TaxID=1562887 RepID=A0ABR5F1L7_9ACTN|nr:MULTISPECIES: hypothetical protein [Protofrankia]KLL10611.1 hypothetical protein FrCorBMG51_16495 [Protofrankia coriariae]ONH35129.1 hypothetical protein BL254_13150 [Protofrankia sp. BMG5.30]